MAKKKPAKTAKNSASKKKKGKASKVAPKKKAAPKKKLVAMKNAVVKKKTGKESAVKAKPVARPKAPIPVEGSPAHVASQQPAGQADGPGGMKEIEDSSMKSLRKWTIRYCGGSVDGVISCKRLIRQVADHSVVSAGL